MGTSIRMQSLLIILSGIASLGFIIAVVAYDLHDIYDENHIMEYAQIALLIAAAWLFFRTTWTDTSVHSNAMRWSMVGMGVLSVSFILRESSTKYWGYDWLTFFTDGKGFNLIMAIVWVYLLAKLLPFWRTYWQVVVQRIKTPTALYLIASALALIAGGVFDKEIFKPELFRFYEEILEFWGYVFLVLAAMNAHHDLAPCSVKFAIDSEDQSNNRDHYLVREGH